MRPALAQPKRRVIDVHNHCFPDAFKNSSSRTGALPGPVRNWTRQVMFEEMDRNGVQQSVISLATAPLGCYQMKNEELRPLIRTINEAGAKLVADNPRKLGTFAFVSGKDVEGSLKEIEYAFDVLKADGIEMMTSFGDKWPRDPTFDPVFTELNRRSAIVYFHPIAPTYCVGLIPTVSESWIDYPYDSTRTVLSLLTSGTLVRYRNIKWIISQAGGTLPFLADRIEWLGRTALKNASEVAPNGMMAEFKRLYYETANAASATTMAALLKFVDPAQVMYSSDHPYVTSEYNLGNLRGQGLREDVLKAIEYQNAEQLIPRMKA